MRKNHLSLRSFLHRGCAFAVAAPFAGEVAFERTLAEATGPANPRVAPAAAPRRSDAKVAVVACRTYGPEVRSALDRCLDSLGGMGSLVKGKTVAIKINLTGTNFAPYLGKPVGETYMTHPDTATALAAALFKAGAHRLVFLESTQSKADLGTSLALAGWDLRLLEGLGKVAFENTRNLGLGKKYASFAVPGGGSMFSAFELNHAYADCDVLVSLAKLKQHITAGVTLSMKNLFGITPNALYGADAGSEDATDGRYPLHDPREYARVKPPGLKPGMISVDPGWRVPRIVADLVGARPVHLAIIDGVMTMTGGEGPWCEDVAKVRAVVPGILIAGLNPVSTDAVGTALMGYRDPRAERGLPPFDLCDNHLLLAERAGAGQAGLGEIEVCGLTIEQARFPFA